MAFGLLQLGRFLPGSWFLGFLLCATSAFYFGVLGYQAYLTDHTGRSEKVFGLQGGAPPGIELRVSYPGTIPLEPADKPGWPLAVYVWSAGAPSSTSATEPLTYSVTFTPSRDNVVVFTNDEGIPIVPGLVASPWVEAEQPALYIRQASPVAESSPFTISVRAHDAQGNPVLQEERAVLELHLEDARSAWRRHFLGLLLGPTTPLLAVAGSVVALGFWWWQEDQKHRREQEEKEQKIREIQRPRSLVEKYRSATDAKERAECLEQAERELGAVYTRYAAIPELQDELRRSTEAVRRAQLEQIRSTVAENWEQAQNQYEKLRERKEAEGWRDPDLLALFAGAEKLIRPPTPQPSPPEIPAVAAWVKARRLKFNPFGPEKAEDDPRFLERCVPPPGRDTMRRAEPTVVVGAPGSGRTAARLLLMAECEQTGLATSDQGPDTLAVPLGLPLEEPASEAAVACRKALAVAIAEANLKQLARCPDLLDMTPFWQQQALAVLFRLTRDAIGDPGVYLERHGLEQTRAEQIARLVRQLSRYVAPPPYDAEHRIVRLLGQARLAPFAQYYVCVEVPDDEVGGEPRAEATVYVRALCEMMPALGKARVFLKFFVGQAEAETVSFPEGIRRAALCWGEGSLRELLQMRLKAADAAGDIRSLFPTVKGNLGGQLIAAALRAPGAPRELIRLGNALVAVSGPLTWEKAKRLLVARKEGSNG